MYSEAIHSDLYFRNDIFVEAMRNTKNRDLFHLMAMLMKKNKKPNAIPLVNILSAYFHGEITALQYSKMIETYFSTFFTIIEEEKILFGLGTRNLFLATSKFLREEVCLELTKVFCNFLLNCELWTPDEKVRDISVMYRLPYLSVWEHIAYSNASYYEDPNGESWKNVEERIIEYVALHRDDLESDSLQKFVNYFKFLEKDRSVPKEKLEELKRKILKIVNRRSSLLMACL